MTSAATRTKLRDLLAPVVTGVGFDLEDVEVTPAGRRSVVRVVVDGENGVALDDVALVSRAVSERLDTAADLLAGAYVLEVSSPGVDRPLSSPRQWRRARGRLVTTTVGGRAVTGRVTQADEHGIVLLVDGEIRAAGYGELGAGHVQLEFQRASEGAPGAAVAEEPVR